MATPSEALPPEEILLAELTEKLSFNLDFSEDLQSTEIYLVGDFNHYGWTEDQGSWRKMNEEELEPFKYRKHGNRYMPPERLRDMVDGKRFKLLIEPPAITTTEADLKNQLSLAELWQRFEDEFQINESIISSHTLGSSVELGLRKLLELKGVDNISEIPYEELPNALEHFTVQDINDFWDSKSKTWILGDLREEERSAVQAMSVQMTREMYRLANDETRTDLYPYSKRAREDRHNAIVNTMANAGIKFDGRENNRVVTENGYSYEKPNYWAVTANIESEEEPGYGSHNRFPKI